MNDHPHDAPVPDEDHPLEELLAPMRDLPLPPSLRATLDHRLQAELRSARGIPWYRRHLSIPLPAVAAAALLVAGVWIIWGPMSRSPRPSRSTEEAAPGPPAETRVAIAATAPESEALHLQVVGFGDVMVTEVHDYRTREVSR